MSQRVESHGGLNSSVPPVSPMTPVTVPVQVMLLLAPAAAGGFNVALKLAAKAEVDTATSADLRSLRILAVCLIIGLLRKNLRERSVCNHCADWSPGRRSS